MALSIYGIFENATIVSVSLQCLHGLSNTLVRIGGQETQKKMGGD